MGSWVSLASGLLQWPRKLPEAVMLGVIVWLDAKLVVPALGKSSWALRTQDV